MKIFKFTALAVLISNFAWAHGEDMYGPHKGFVRMPGAFHTELVPDSKNSLKVYLLDIQWKNPSVLQAKVQIKYNGKTEAQCDVKNSEPESYFLCSFSKKVDLTKTGELKVIAEREEQKGMGVSYKLPLKLEMPKEKTNNPSENSNQNMHNGHH